MGAGEGSGGRNDDHSPSVCVCVSAGDFIASNKVEREEPAMGRDEERCFWCLCVLLEWTERVDSPSRAK